MNTKRFAIAVTLGMLVLILALLWVLTEQPALAQPVDVSAGLAELTVCPVGPPDCDYDVIQDAVDAASDGDVIKVATGIYTDVQGRTAPPGYNNPPASGIITQVVYVSKTVIVRGGYATPDFVEPPEPQTNPTTLDAQGQGRVLVIAGTISPTLEGLHITGGNAYGLGGKPAGSSQNDAGSGALIVSATVTISNAEVRGNDGWGHGGGLYLNHSDALLKGNSISDNRDSFWSAAGGGLYLDNSSATLISNTISHNGAAGEEGGGSGGGLYLDNSSATLISNTISHNWAGSFGGNGGGLSLHTSSATLIRNTISHNSTGFYSGQGGGLSLYKSSATLISNTISNNSASGDPYSSGVGGGLSLVYGDAVLIRNTISYNRSSGRFDASGGGVNLYGANATLIGNLILGNSTSGMLGGNGGGLYMEGGSLELIGNTIRENESSGAGGATRIRAGGLYLGDCDRATLTNNVVAGNQARVGSGLYLEGCSSRLLHTTLVGNGGNDSGVYVGGAATVALTNTILVSHTVGITVAAGSTATLEATLWGAGTWANEADWAGEGYIFSGTINVWGDPVFTRPDTGNYHIAGNSAARDAGLNAGVTTDIDGQSRPYDSGYDIGADEYCPTAYIYLPLVLRNGP
jgi:hypothetical protein